MAGSGESAEGDVGFQIAPMIDLILVLMVFFMSTVALKQIENELETHPPGPGKSDVADQPIQIGIEMDGSINFNGEIVAAGADRELSGLRGRLEEQVQIFDTKIPVIISPQPDVAHARVIEVLNACSGAKITNISFGG